MTSSTFLATLSLSYGTPPSRRLKHVMLAGVACLAGFAAVLPALAQEKTEKVYLSGKGPKDAVPWEFTVTGGRRANEKTSIAVPSDWEQQGFGSYNYGDDKSPHSSEHGLYRLKFKVPAEWKGRRVRIVFGAVMTDATVKVNGEQVGPTHVGGYSQFSFDITKQLKPESDNVLEVDVAKVSSNINTTQAERKVDFWIFGGIYRPVWLEATPTESIAHAAIDAKADGSLTADVDLDAPQTATRLMGQVTTLAGEPVGDPFSAAIPAGGSTPLRLSTRIASPKLWNAETPNLYDLKLTLFRGGEPLHTTTQRFGFRTFEIRPNDGVYVNGQRILLKGVNIQSFRPETGRALDREQFYEDVRLIKSMNMNAVRLSMFPHDPAILDAADELGLYTIDELTSWQHGHDTFVGRTLVRELVERDVNHPSIMFWTNGNEGGWNRDLDGEFSRYDPQHRRVLHPWEVHDDVETYHYPSYSALTKRLAGKNVYFPTEVLHGLFDGGHGAGMEDYWKAITTSRVGGGMFLWSLADEGLARTDRGGEIDVFGTYGADGIVGPHHEKEGSYYTVKDIWSPVQIQTPDLGAGFDGTLKLTNGYDFTSLAKVNFKWQLVRFAEPDAKRIAPTILATGTARGPDVAPHASGTVKLGLPPGFSGSLVKADAMLLTATGPSNEELWTWTWPTRAPVLPAARSGGTPTVVTSPQQIRLSAGAVNADFDPQTGELKSFTRGNQVASISSGPRLVYAKASKLRIPDPYGKEPLDPKATLFDIPWTALDAKPDVQLLKTPQMANIVEVQLKFLDADSYAKFKIEVSPDGRTWKTLFDSTRRGIDGERFVLPPQMIGAVRISQPVSDAGRVIPIKAIRLGYEADRYPPATMHQAYVKTGQNGNEAWVEAAGAGGLDHVRWTMRSDGSLKLDYDYKLTGEYVYHGVTFDQRQDGLVSMKRLADGPSRVWQNRLRGTNLEVTETPYHIDAPGTFNYPEFQGFFGDLRWVRFDSASGPLVVTNGKPDVYLRVGTPLLGHGGTSVEFPAGDLSFLASIPAVGSKVVTLENSGPSAQPTAANGTYAGSLLFSLPPK